MTKMKNMQKRIKHYTDLGFLTKLQKKPEMEIFAICVITFNPIGIQTYLAPQNDRLNLSFVKDIHVVGEKMTRSGFKMAI